MKEKLALLARQPRSLKDLAVGSVSKETHMAREIAFVDSTVSDVDVLLSGLRSNVDAVVLDVSGQALSQISKALFGRPKVAAIHILAHGRPGEMIFGSGPLSIQNLGEHRADLQTIGKALQPCGDLLLWSCRTGQGDRGRAFVEAVKQVAGADVAAATGPVGAAAEGGRWQLDVGSDGIAPVAPLTVQGKLNYRWVMGTVEGTNSDDTIYGTSGPDLLQGFGGKDTLIGLEGDDILDGGPGKDFLDAGPGDDTLIGGPGNDFLEGGTGLDRAIYTEATDGISVDMAAGTVSGPLVGKDTLDGIELVRGSNFDDTYVATGFTGTSSVPGVVAGFNEFEGMGGNDTITGNNYTRISYLNATGPVTVDLAAGTAAGDDSVGTDMFTGVNAVRGSAYDDTLLGSDNGLDTAEFFLPGPGDDFINGRGGYDQVQAGTVIGNEVTSGITVNLADGILTGDASVGTDTLRSVEGVRGTNFVDVFDATGFSGSSNNAGSFDTFNDFQGLGGDDIIIGNGNTRISYALATAPVQVDLNEGTADGDASGHDTFTGVNSVQGSSFGDVFYGSNNPSGTTESFEGREGSDIIYGRGGFDRVIYSERYLDIVAENGVAVYLAAGTVYGGDAFGNDTISSVEAVRGSFLADYYDARGFSGTSINAGSFGTFNEFEGRGGDDTIYGNGNTRIAYYNATGGVTVNLSAPAPGAPPGATGTVTGDDSVGTDTIFGGVNQVSGSSFDDSITGSNLSDTLEGRAGNDFLDGRGGFDQAIYNNDVNVTSGISIDMAAGTVVGDASVGSDALRSIEGVRGTNFADNYVATGFGPSSTNVGSNGTFNQFEGMGGDDIITGNGNTRIVFGNATGGVTADLAVGTATGNASVGTDTFTGVNSASGSNFGDTILGGANNNILLGLGGDDIIVGRGGNDTITGGAGDDTFVYADGDGADTITDFRAPFQGLDKIDLTGVSGVQSLSDVLALGTQNGPNAVINFGNGNSITLNNVAVSNLTADDFIFAADLATGTAAGLELSVPYAGTISSTQGSGKDSLTEDSTHLGWTLGENPWKTLVSDSSLNSAPSIEPADPDLNKTLAQWSQLLATDLTAGPAMVQTQMQPLMNEMSQFLSQPHH
jgi:Ca2+-binding RTX toxin-like protein